MKSFILVGAAALFCLGCAPAAEKTQPLSTAQSLRLEIELRHESTGEKSRTHKFNADDVEVETEIVYNIGSKKTLYWDELGKLKEIKLTHINSDQLSEHIKLQPGSQMIVWKEQYAINGKVNLHLEQVSPGKYKYARYLDDGTPIVVQNTKLNLNKDGSGELEIQTDYTHQRTPLPLTRYAWDGKGKMSEKMFYDSGNQLKQLCESDTQNQALVCTVYRRDGTIEYRQYFNVSFQQYYSRYYLPRTCTKSEIFSDDGKRVIRTFIFDRWLKEVRLANDDGSTHVLSFDNYGRDLVGEKIYDKDGKLVSEKASTDLDLDDLLANRFDYLTIQRLPQEVVGDVLSDYIYKDKP
ncbi:MAG: hypothetical protein K2W82_18190 [Candidatus Obscuribacterales bacterium]|nr:hypothetical protein [Candidatus Obscuribacterales bacterium]